MKKYLITIALMFPLFASAQTVDSTADLQALIKQLQVQIQSLQAQIVDIQAQVQSVKIELNFSRVLTQGTTGDDVKQLQEFLKNFTGAYPNGLITGYFGPLTQAAVKKFQAQNGIESVGIVGPKTQDKLNVLAGAIPVTTVTTPSITQTTSATSATPIMSVTPTIPAAPQITTPATPCINCSPTVPFTSSVIKVLSPNGGEQWQIGGTYTIKYSAKNIVGNEPLLIYLEKGYDAPTTKTGVNSSLLIGVTTNLESYAYTVPSNIQSWPGLGSNYTIKVLGAGAYYANDAISYIDDSSDALFSIVAGQDNALNITPTVPVNSPVKSSGGGGYGVIAPPIPTPISTPTPVPVNSISATPSQATPTTQDQITAISKQIGALQNQLNTTTDDATRTSLMAQIVALKAQMQALQNTLITPQSSGSTTTSTAQVQVVPSINVISPNGGETLTTGQTCVIKWTGGNNAVDVYLLDNPTRLGKKIFSGITNNNYVSWVAVPLSSSDLLNPVTNTYATPSGQYVIWVGCTDNNCTVDDSDSYFKIVE